MSSSTFFVNKIIKMPQEDAFIVKKIGKSVNPGGVFMTYSSKLKGYYRASIGSVSATSISVEKPRKYEAPLHKFGISLSSFFVLDQHLQLFEFNREQEEFQERNLPGKKCIDFQLMQHSELGEIFLCYYGELNFDIYNATAISEGLLSGGYIYKDNIFPENIDRF